MKLITAIRQAQKASITFQSVCFVYCVSDTDSATTTEYAYSPDRECAIKYTTDNTYIRVFGTELADVTPLTTSQKEDNFWNAKCKVYNTI